MDDKSATTASEEKLRLQGNDAFGQMDYSRAVELYTTALATAYPSSNSRHKLYGNRAAAHLKLGLLTEALNDATSATAIQPTWCKGWYRKAAALEALGRLTEAVAASRQGTELGRSNELTAQLGNLRQLSYQETNGSERQELPADTIHATTGHEISTECAAAFARRAVQPGHRLKAMHSGGRLSASHIASLLPPEMSSSHRFHHSQDGADTNLLLLFHGLGDRPEAFATLAQRMQLPQTAALALAGPAEVPFTDGGRSWFDAFDEEGHIITTGKSTATAIAQRNSSLAATLRVLQRVIERLTDGAKGGWPCSRIHLFGFSQGGTVALHLGAANWGNLKLGSCAAISAAMILTCSGTPPVTLLPLPHATPSSSSNMLGASGFLKVSSGKDSNSDSTSTDSSCKKATPVFISHGDSDAVVPRDDVIATCSFINASCPGSAEFVPLQKGHSMIDGPMEMRTLMTFWAKHLGATPIAENDLEEFVELSA